VSFSVQFTHDARADLADLKEYVVQHRSMQAWRAELDHIKHAVTILQAHPNAGAVCPDLAALGITAYRQVLASHYRIVYEVDDAARRIFVHIVCEQRRDLHALLMRRMLVARPPA
jgi:toxin ParE1/3/4